MKPEGICLLASSLCDLHCKYCYIIQDKSNKKIQQEIFNRIENESFLDPALNFCKPENIKVLSFWGLEPTKALDTISKRFDYIFKTLPKLETFSFSSNFQGPNDRIINFIKKIGTDRKIKIEIQVSLDGMPEINDLTRGKGSGDRVISNLKSLIDEFIDIKKNQSNIYFFLHDKCTINSNVLEIYDKDENILKENFRYINNLYSELYSKSKNIIKISLGGMNHEQPFAYSKEHGIMFYNMLKKLKKLKQEEDLKYIILPLYQKLNRVIKFGKEFNNKNLMFTCRASVGNISIGTNPNILPYCHRDFFPNKEKSVVDFKNNFYSLKLNKDNIRQEYLVSCYSDFPKLKLEYIIIMCKELAYCGLIDKSYENYDKAYILAMFLVSESCPSASLDEFCSPYLKDIGYIKLLANGAFDFLLKEVICER